MQLFLPMDSHLTRRPERNFSPQACIEFNSEQGTWPADMDELVDSGIWADADRADPWGYDYEIEGEGSSVTVMSYGADNEPDGEDADGDYSSDAGR